MSSKRLTIMGCAALSFLTAARAFAQEAAAEAPADAEGAAEAVEQVDPLLKGEIAYVEALIDCRLPDFAEEVIAATKKKWPESDTMFFALEIRGMLSLGKYEEVDKKIAALTDRKSAKYWAARLELANNHFQHGRKDKCATIYEEFFKQNEKPSKELFEFVRNARYQWAQILIAADRRLEAAQTLDKLLPMYKRTDDLEGDYWCGAACEATELYLSLASEKELGKRKDLLVAARRHISKLLWCSDRPLYFGRAIAMKAYYELLMGNVQKAQNVVDDYRADLQAIHDQLVQHDPDGRGGLLRMSPIPQCRYLMAEKSWKAAQEEFKKSPRDDEKVKSLLFGQRGADGKRNGKGAFNESVNVFLRFPQSVWAPAANKLQKEIAAFVRENYNVDPKFKATPEQERHVMESAFKSADDKYDEGTDYAGAIADYYVALTSYPEELMSVRALENIVVGYRRLAAAAKDEATKESLILNAEAVAGYLAERFGGCKDPRVMIAAGDAVMRLASDETQGKEASKRLWKLFIRSYTNHAEAPSRAFALGVEAQRAAFAIAVQPVSEDDSEDVRAEKEKLLAERDALIDEALSFYDEVIKRYKKSLYFEGALVSSSACWEKLGNRPKAIEFMKKDVDSIDGAKQPLKKMKAQMRLAILFQKDGLAMLDRVPDLQGAEAERVAKEGSGQIIRGIKQFRDFAATSKERMASPHETAADKEQYSSLREGALYLVGDSWNRLMQPAAKIEMFRRNAAENLEQYVAEYPTGKYSTNSYVKLGRLYSQLGEVEKGKEALLRLRNTFPESEEAKKAMPQLANSLVEITKDMPDGERKEALLKTVREIYGEMLENTKNDYRPSDYARAGEVLIEAKSWSLAADAFAKAEALAAKTNQLTVVARARLGRARSSLAQNMIEDAREALDDFMEDETLSHMMVATNACDMLVTVAVRQGRKERDAALRRRHFGTAIGAVKRLRSFWSGTNEQGQMRVPQWQLDHVELMSADVSIAQMEAESVLGTKEAADKACSMAAMKLQTYLSNHEPTEEHPFEKYGPHERANLEHAYVGFVTVLSKMGDAHGGEVVAFGRRYVELFPEGPGRSAVDVAVAEAIQKGATASETGASLPKVDASAAVEEEEAEAEAAPAPAAEQPAETEPVAEPAPEAGAETAAE